MLFQMRSSKDFPLECLRRLSYLSKINVRGVNPYLRTFNIIWIFCIGAFYNWNHLNDTRCTLFANSIRFPKAIKFKYSKNAKLKEIEWYQKS